MELFKLEEIDNIHGQVSTSDHCDYSLPQAHPN